MNPRNRSMLLRAVEANGDVFTPPCACGCGEPVPIRVHGVNLYVNIAHSNWHWQRKVNRVRYGTLGPVVEIVRFRAAITKIRESKGWTLEQCARAGGWSVSRLTGVLYGPRPYILESTARAFLLRLAGAPAPMTAWEKRQVEGEVKAGRKAIRQIERAYL